MSQITDLPSNEKALGLLNAVAPGSTLTAVRAMADDHHNEAYTVEGLLTNGEPIQVVAKRYVNNHHVVSRARLEFNSLRWLYNNGVPVPEPLYLDDTGERLGSPGILTRFVAGHQMMQPSEHPFGPQAWTQAMAQTLARIHTTPIDSAAEAMFRSGTYDDSNVLWFMKSETMPDYLKAHELGQVVWDTIHAQLSKLKPVRPTLTHTDYWPGNILWRQGKIVAVLDWEEATYSNPNADVAYCRMDLFLTGNRAAADELLHHYENMMGHSAADLGFWQLAAAVRPLFRPEGWITGSPAQDRFQQFVQDALNRVNVE